MEGIEILNSREVVVKEKFNWKWFFIMFSLMIVIYFVLVQFAFIAVDTEISNITSISSLIFGGIWGIISGVFMGNLNAIPVKYTMEHKIAILDESVRDEVLEKYEIIEQEGKLWTVREVL